MRLLALGIASVALAQTATAQIAVSANDGKARPPWDAAAARSADSIAVIDLGRTPVRQLATLAVPGSVVGPPSGVALTRDSRLAIVASASGLDSAGAIVSTDTVSVIDLARPARPQLVQTAQAGKAATSVAIHPTGRLVAVTNMEGDSMSLFTLAKGRLTPAGTVTFEPRTRPVDIGFAPDGRTAYVVSQARGTLIPMAVAGTTLTPSGTPVAIGAAPYSLTIDPKGARAYVSLLGGRAPSTVPGPKPGAIAVVDLAAGRLVEQVDTGITPEHVGLSPDGRYLAAVVHDGSLQDRPHGKVVVYRTDAAGLTKVAEAETGRWCQGAAWRADASLLLVQCSAEKTLAAYRFDGRALIPAPGSTITLDARPGAIGTARHN